MIIINTADQHARGEDLESFRAQWNELWQLATLRGADAVLSAGDLFDSDNIHDKNAETGAIIDAVKSPLLSIPGRPPLYIVSGNHEQLGPGRATALRALSGIDNVHIFEPGGPVYTSISKDIEKVGLYMLPWYYDGMEKQLESLAEKARASAGEHKILVAHAQVMGGNLMKIKTSEEGIERDHPAWSAFDKIVLGDFHKRQQLWRNGGYIGALRQLGFGEENNPAGFEVYDTTTGYAEWVELDEAPKHETTYIQNLDDVDSIDTKEDGVLHRAYFQDIQPPPDVVRMLESKGVKVKIDIPRAERIDRGVEVDKSAIKNPRDLIRLYCDTLDENEFDLDDLLDLYDRTVSSNENNNPKQQEGVT